MKYFVDDWNNVWKNVPVERSLASDADVFLLWQDVTPKYRDFIERVHEMDKKVIVLQHGRHSTTDYTIPPATVPIADKHLVWGDSDVRRMESTGYKNFVKVGCPLFTMLKPRLEHVGKNVVFAPGHFTIEHNENLLIAKALREAGFNVFSKILPVHLEHSYDNPTLSTQVDEDHMEKVADILRTADVVVDVEDGTFAMLAMSLDIPVVVVKCLKPFEFNGRWVDENHLKYSKGVAVATMDNLIEKVNIALAHPEELKEERKQTCIEDGGLGMDAVNNIIKEI